MADQTPIDHADQLWCKLAQEYPLMRGVSPDIEEKRKQLQRKEVVISAFGRHNCGKSTFLNVILRNSLLPTSEDNETCIEIKIKHDRTVHPGPCSNNCHEGSDCPRLEREVSPSESHLIARGAQAIEQRLKQENKDHRQIRGETEGGHHSFILYAFVSILEETPDGWSLVLVDTPGFGEANVDHVMQHTDLLFKASTAYIYIMDSTSMEDKVDHDNIRLLFEHDKEIFRDGRIIVVVNKYDMRFSEQSLRLSRRQGRTQTLSPADVLKSLNKKALTFVTKTIDSDLPSSFEIVPVSSSWAETAMFVRCVPSDPQDLKAARHIVEDFSDIHPQGEGGVAAMKPQELAATVERLSRLPNLEERLKEMIKKCIEIWRASLASAYTGYLREAMGALRNHQQTLNEKREYIAKKAALHAEYFSKKQQLTGMAYVEAGRRAEIVIKLEQKYAELDIEPVKRILHHGLEEIFTRYAHTMKSKYFTGTKLTPFTPECFEEDMNKFLQEEVEKAINHAQLNTKMEGVLGVFRESLRDMEQLDREIEVIALDILPKEWSPQNDDLQRERAAMKGDREVLSDEVLQKQSLTLQDLCQRIEPPEIKLGFFDRIWDKLRKLFHGRGIEEEQYEKWADEVMISVKAGLVQRVDTYITGDLQKWVIEEVLSVEFRGRVKRRCDALLGTYDPHVNQAKQRLEEEKKNCATDSYTANLETNISELERAKTSLETM